MKYYKVLLVDDEEDVRQSIVKKLDWAGLGFEVVGEAGNGEEAMEMAEQLEPDVVMTDIKMPFMDGLELCRRVKQLLPGVRVAVFSGFDKFEYAKEAITQQVEEYILKPIDAGELAEVFRRLRQGLDEEIAQRRNMERLRLYYEESIPVMHQQLLSSLLDPKTASADVIVEKLLSYGIDITASGYCVAVIRYEYDSEIKQTEESQFLALSLEQLISDNLKDSLSFHMIHMPDRIALLFLLEKNQDAKTVTTLLGRLFPISKRILSIRLSIGIGNMRARPEEISHSYNEALSALEYQLLMTPGHPVYIGDIEPVTDFCQFPDTGYSEQVLLQIKVGGKQELEQAVSTMLHYLKDSQPGLQQSQIYLLMFFTELLKLIRAYDLNQNEAGQDSLISEGIALNFADMVELDKWLLSYCENLRQLIRRQRKDSVRDLIEKAKDILHKCYADSDLSLDLVCTRLNVSGAYFSTIFKKETGQGFVSYLTELRMEKALELLANTGHKTYQIAEMTGYTDPNYFSYVFKRKFGVPPSKYRAI